MLICNRQGWPPSADGQHLQLYAGAKIRELAVHGPPVDLHTHTTMVVRSCAGTVPSSTTYWTEAWLDAALVVDADDAASLLAPA